MSLDIQTIEQQLENFKKGFPYVNLVKPAFVKDGITVFEKEEIEQYAKIFDEAIKFRKVLKFVPASGVASRMFQHLFLFRDKYKGSDKDILALESDKNFNSVYRFIREIRKFAFYNDLKKIMTANHLNIDECMQNHDYATIINYLLDENGLGYGTLPKGLLKFHHYGDASRTAIEEHLVEAAHYAIGADNIASIHFTLSPEHIEKFNQHIQSVQELYEKQFKVRFKIGFSIQKPSTDTVAVDMENEFFRNGDRKILFRPGGHGALIENLNDLNEDIIFIKNIDNIVPDKLKELTFLYKKMIGGYLISLQQKTFEYLHLLENAKIDDGILDEIIDFAHQYLMIRQQEDFEEMSRNDKINFLYHKLNRPIRVCGMVKNEGEPGGGPFWVRNSRGETTLQIVESSQINLNDSGQMLVFTAATHFNPVDLVCGLRNYKGEAFDLKDFIDPSTGFISIKSKDGRHLKAQELPGLWNGAMAEWISVFVEVPIITFNPVKTINDLIRVEHQ